MMNIKHLELIQENIIDRTSTMESGGQIDGQGLIEGAEDHSSCRPSSCNRSLRIAAHSPTKDDREEEKSNPLIKQLREAVNHSNTSVH